MIMATNEVCRDIDTLIASAILKFPPPQDSKFERNKIFIARLIYDQRYPVTEVCRILVSEELMATADASQLRKWLKRRSTPGYVDRNECFREAARRILEGVDGTPATEIKSSAPARTWNPGSVPTPRTTVPAAPPVDSILDADSNSPVVISRLAQSIARAEARKAERLLGSNTK